MLQAYSIAFLGILLGQMTPGPNLLAVAGAALGHGRRTAIFVTLGIACATFLWVTVAAFGLAAALAVHPGILVLMKLAGGGYLCLMAVRALIASLRTGNGLAVRSDAVPMTPREAWRRGLFVNLSNPKSVLIWAAIGSFLFGSGLSTLEVWLVAPLSFLSALAIYGIYGMLFSTDLAQSFYRRSARGVEAAFGLAFGAIGGRLVFDAAGELVK